MNMINEIINLIEKKRRLNGSCIVAIEGRCGAGKTTVAKKLAEHFACDVFHADDFYIQFEKRTEDRLGNVDCDRLLNEVLTPLKAGEDFSYRPYLCSKGAFSESIMVKSNSVAIVEGSYCCQGNLFDFYDLHIFVDVDKNVQQQRLFEREGEVKIEAFNTRWIPMEENYFAMTELKYKCEIYYKTSV